MNDSQENQDRISGIVETSLDRNEVRGSDAEKVREWIQMFFVNHGIVSGLGNETIEVCGWDMKSNSSPLFKITLKGEEHVKNLLKTVKK